ncbi:Aspartic proteinase Asp1 [Orchesella cincta]|uniref:Aspartic proteinase Asp1 n=1 Tax=Orchesella cincta TaxID=48709 RepID=A0A1D2NEP9_ORCCI|nr:Aspartic proteinase Asp1 [Orchesella cincta]
MDGENDGNNDRNLPPEEDGALRRNQVLIFGVVLLGILAICLAVSMPSDLEFNDSELPTSGTPMNPDTGDRSSLPSDDPSSKRNQTNSTSRKKSLRNQEVSVEVKLLRDMAIQKKIQEYDSSNSGQGEVDLQEEDASLSKEQLELKKVDNIVETFIGSEDFEDFLLDIEIHDAVKKLREQKGYKKKSSTLFDELFKRAEKEFIGEDEEELRLIRKVGEKLEKRAWDIINERRKTRGKDLTEPDELIANELLKLDYASSGDADEADEELVEEVRKTEL